MTGLGQISGDVSIDEFAELLRRADSSADSGATRLALAQRFSYVLPDSTALELLCALGPLIEIGAGTGYWAWKLRVAGSDVVPLDQAPPDGDTPNRYHAPTATWTEVLPGDQHALGAHADRALLLCWPPLFSSLGDCLNWYTGNTVACIGDGGHRTARLAGLNECFDMIAIQPVRALDPFPGIVPTLSIWRRHAAR